MSRIVFRCDAATLPEIGTGHVVRDLAIANAFVKTGIASADQITFATRKTGPFEPGARILGSSGYKHLDIDTFRLIPNSDDEAAVLSALDADVIIFDRLATTSETIERVKEAGKKIITLDDEGGGRDFANLAINAILYDPDEDLRRNPRILAGYKYLILPSNLSPGSKIHSTNPTLFASFGGYDKSAWTLLLLEAIPYLDSSPNIQIAYADVEGSSPEQIETAAENIHFKGKIEILQRPDNFFQLLYNADLAVVSGGLTLFECAAAGIPSISVPQYEHQKISIKRLSDLGATISADDSVLQSPQQLATMINQLFDGDSLRNSMSNAGRRCIDGQGLIRTIDAIARCIEERNS